MIRLENVDKYYNRGRSNQIHVIDNTSMTLPDRGIVCLLGPSGCGKTTLLNAIGGLDKVNSGHIYIDDQEITRAYSGKVDKLRNARIGYIFQNFNLLDDRTVFDNVAIALKMVGIKDAAVIRDRVNYCLEKVGIYQYRNKLAGALSGGQRQRVAIARAIVKNPRIIIADEPTGNLDSANTLEIMNIIKTISRDRLVLLVTHERKIAEFYSDHVAEMKDGRIVKAYNNDSSRFLDYQLENKLYLKDMPVVKDLKEDDVSIKVYSEEERQADIKVVIKGNNLYIDTGGRLNVVDESSNIEMIDDHYQAMDESFFRDNDFDYNAHLPKDFKAKYTSIYNFGNLIIEGWKTVKNFKKVRKFLMIGFVFAAMFTFLAVSNVLGIINVEPEDYRTTNGNYITVSNPDKNDKLLEIVESLDSVTYVLPGDTKTAMTFPMDDYLQTSYAQSALNVSVCKSSVLEEEDIIYGRLPEDDHEVVIDKMIIDNFLREKRGINVGIDSMEKFLGRRLTVSNLKDYKICGISETRSPSMFTDEGQIINILTNGGAQSEDYYYGYMEEDDGDGGDVIKSGKVKDVAIADKNVKLKKGSKPKNLYETMVNVDHQDEEAYKIGKTLNVKLGGHKLKVVGYYESANANEDTYYVSNDTIRKDYVSKQKNFTVYTDDIRKVRSLLTSQNISYRINDTRDRKAYVSQRNSQLTSALLVAGIILLISLVEMFLMLRSSFLSRIKEVGTMRAIGLKKRDIYRMFAGEILVITVITAIPGIAIMYYILSNLVKITFFLESLYLITPTVALIALAVDVIFNLLVGLIPVYNTMRKTPAQILARTDI